MCDIIVFSMKGSYIQMGEEKRTDNTGKTKAVSMPFKNQLHNRPTRKLSQEM